MKTCLFNTSIIIISVLIFSQNYSYAQCPTPQRNFIVFGSKNDSIAAGDQFQKLGKYYAKDSKSVFYNYIRDIGSARAVIVETYHVINGADPKTFRITEELNFAYDVFQVYFQGFLIEGASPEGFKPLNDRFSKDGNDFYQRTCKVVGVDRDTFKVVGNDYYSYAYDKNYLYFNHHKIEIDVRSFNPLESNYCEDKNYKYWLTEKGIKKEKISKK